jgi:hypothetical protein
VSDKTWKAVERRVARILDGRRVGATGAATPDVDAGWLVAEVKHRARLPQWLTTAAAKVRSQAGSERLGVVVLHEKGARGGLVCLNLYDFRDWFGGGLDGEVQDGGGQ